MKKNKLQLSQLKVQSFVTAIGDASAIHGGSVVTNQTCVSDIGQCTTVYWPSVNAPCTDTRVGPCTTTTTVAIDPP